MRYRSLWKFLLSAVLIAGLLMFSADISEGIKQGISLCLNTIIPSLFSFIVLSAFLLKSGFADILLTPLKKPISFIFGVPPKHASIVFMSLIGGYPVGASLLTQKLRSKQISVKQTERMLCFCVNSGPAFLIGTVGIPLMGDARFGLIICASQITAAAIIANITRKADDKQSDSFPQSDYHSVGRALVDATQDGCRSMITICSLILVFSSVFSVLKQFKIISLLSALFSVFLSDSYTEILTNGILEVCRGCALLSKVDGYPRLIFASGLTAFAGLCVHMQISAITAPYGVSLKRFFCLRPIYTAIAVLFTCIYTRLFNLPIPAAVIKTSSLGNGVYAHISSAFLIFICFLLLLNAEKSDMIKKDNSSQARKEA